MLQDIFSISLSMSAVIAVLILVSPFLNKRYTAKWRYFVWLILAVRLMIPLNITLPQAPITVETPKQTVVYRQHESVPMPLSLPVAIMDDSYIGMGNQSPNSADYAPIITVENLLGIIWFVGFAAFLLYRFVGYFIFRSKIKHWCKVVDEGKPKVLICRKIVSPMLIGFIKPTILLPNIEYKTEDLTAILAHETAHYKRCDLWYKLLMLFANAVHWFNPLVYVMVHFANKDMELSCDDMVVKNKDLQFRKAYSNTILNTLHSGTATPLSTYFKGGKKTMKQRFSNILDMRGKKKGVLAFTVIFVVMVIAGTLVACQKINYEGMPEPASIKWERQIKEYLDDIFTDEYTQFYDNLKFEISNYSYKIEGDDFTATFFYKMKHTNYYKDPDTVDYIIQAKESGSPSYQALYDDYNAEHEGNYDFQVTAKTLPDGSIDISTIKVLGNGSPKGTEYYVPLGDYFVHRGVDLPLEETVPSAREENTATPPPDQPIDAANKSPDKPVSAGTKPYSEPKLKEVKYNYNQDEGAKGVTYTHFPEKTTIGDVTASINSLGQSRHNGGSAVDLKGKFYLAQYDFTEKGETVAVTVTPDKNGNITLYFDGIATRIIGVDILEKNNDLKTLKAGDWDWSMEVSNNKAYTFGGYNKSKEYVVVLGTDSKYMWGENKGQFIIY